MSLAGAMITLAEGVLYPFYAAAPRVWASRRWPISSSAVY